MLFLFVSLSMLQQNFLMENNRLLKINFILLGQALDIWSRDHISQIQVNLQRKKIPDKEGFRVWIIFPDLRAF